MNQPVAGLTLEAEPAAANSINPPTETVVGLLPAPAVHHLDDSDVLAEAEVDFERIDDVLKQLTRVVDNSKVRQEDETSAVMGWFQPLLDKLNGSTINAHLNTWHDSETVLHEALLNLTTKALAKAVELKEKAVVELDKIDAAEKEKLRLIEIAREDFKNILSGQQAELGLLDAGFEEKTKALRKKAEKLLTTDEISAEALANVNRRQSTKVKARR
ncbi:hypothetical protein CspHIS471_0602770 [Cutaneotrichosporon sp. HIS471]|nr:hypothetical protein CspHIS471_0602770 [Cutaneotrichosporon sp. HIS471]